MGRKRIENSGIKPLSTKAKMFNIFNYRDLSNKVGINVSFIFE